MIICFSVAYSFKHSNQEKALNTISNTKSLQGFYDRLDSLETNNDEKVSIVHIGDSHIQADFLTGTVRRNLQQRFGNAGRGFVFPYKIARSGGALDVLFKHKGSWQYCNIMNNYSSCDIGVAGFTVTPQNNSSFFIDVASKAETNSSFNKITILDVNGSFTPSKAFSNYNISYTNENTILNFDQLQDSVEIKPLTIDNNFPQLQGLVLENGKSGILYHAIGVNGSSTLQYLRSNSFENQIADLNASLVIISFGTNDCYLPSSRFCEFCVKERYKTLIKRLRAKNPKISILLTSPPDHFYHRKYPNKNIQKLRNAMLQLVEEENVALWDLYEIMGGERSIQSWRAEDLARGDLIHFTKEGYYKQGELLYDALIEPFNK
ncbi:MAG: hypothetical protein KJP21_06230 [Bacteroidia bacterium]|nr:hypothetical protein [Bacteroidia bacterium]